MENKIFDDFIRRLRKNSEMLCTSRGERCYIYLDIVEQLFKEYADILGYQKNLPELDPKILQQARCDFKLKILMIKNDDCVFISKEDFEKLGYGFSLDYYLKQFSKYKEDRRIFEIKYVKKVMRYRIARIE